MANLTAAIQHLRRTRQQLDAPPPQDFDRYRSEYEGILKATEKLAGQSAFDDLHDWMIQSTKGRKRLPTPDEVQTRAREICMTRDIVVPSNSPLR